MKVKNIMFSGFAAAILMGTVSANAATTAFQIASKAYVDSKASTGLVDESTGNPISVADALAGKADAADVESLETSVGTLETAVETLTGNASTSGSVAEAKAAADAAQDDVDALEEAVGEVSGLTGFAQGTDTVVEALNELNSGKADATDLTALESRVSANETIIKSTGETIPSTIGTTQNVTTIVGAINALKTKTDSMATSDTMTQVTTDIQDLQNALGSGFGSNNTVAAALADKADASTVATDAEVAALLGNGVDTTNTVTAQLATKASASDVTALQTLTSILNGYSTCIEDNANESGHCVLSAHAASGNTPAGMEWVFVTDPWTE